MIDLLGEGVKLMVIGMTVVFAFLLLLVWTLSLMSALAARLEPKSQPSEGLPPGNAPALDAIEEGPSRVAVIAAAISEYRRRHRP